MHHRAREIDGFRIPVAGELVDVWTAGIRQAEKLPNLVERLPCCVVHGLPEQSIIRDPCDIHEHRVPAADDEADCRTRPALAKERRKQVTFHVIHAKKRLSKTDGEPLCHSHSNHQRRRKPGTTSCRKGIHFAEPDAGRCKRRIQCGAEHAQMTARCDLGNHTTGRRVQCDLRRHFAREQNIVAENRDGRLVARAFDCKNGHASYCGFRDWKTRTPFSASTARSSCVSRNPASSFFFCSSVRSSRRESMSWRSCSGVIVARIVGVIPTS